MSIATLIRSMSNAGAPPEAIALAIEAIEAAQGALEQKRLVERDRKRRQRDRDKDGTVTGQSRDSHAHVTDAPPVLDKETSPRPPKEINLTPRVGSALTRKAAGFGPPDGVELPKWNEFCAQRRKPLSSTAYAAIVNKLTEAAEVGWPPGDVVGRSIESGWETVFIPTEPRNGNRPANDHRKPHRRADEIDDAASFLGAGRGYMASGLG